MEPDEGLHKGALVAVVMQTALSWVQTSSSNAPASLCSPAPSLLPSNITHPLQTALHLVSKRTENTSQTNFLPNCMLCGTSTLGTGLGCSLHQLWASFLFLICYEFSFRRKLFMDIRLNPGIFWLCHIYDDYSVSGTQRQWSIHAQRNYEPNNPHKHPRSITHPDDGSSCEAPLAPVTHGKRAKLHTFLSILFISPCKEDIRNIFGASAWTPHTELGAL